MNKYENAMKLMEEFCGNGKDNLIALTTRKYGEWLYIVDFAKKEVK